MTQRMPSLAKHTNDINKAIQTLKHSRFIGNYCAKQLVSELNQYKNVIILHPNETELIDTLRSIRRQMTAGDYGKWFGYEYMGPAGDCIWAEFSAADDDAVDVAAANAATPTAFGEYSFRIESVQHTTSAVELIVQPVRPVTPTGGILADTTIGCFLQGQQHLFEQLATIDVWAYEKGRALCAAVAHFYRNELNWTNVRHWLYMLAVLCIAGVRSSVQVVSSLGEFSLRFLDTLERLLRTAAPIFLALISLCGKIVGGAYILLAMVWRDLFGSGNAPARRMVAARPNASYTGYGRRSQNAYNRQTFFARQ